MIHLDYIDRALSPQTTPVVCMHCEDPACANVCPADAIKQTPDGVVQSALADRCIGCGNCVLACPFGVPKYVAAIDQMMKCDLCYDRTSVGLKPMCATVCPSGALWYGPREEIEKHRRERPLNTFVFGRQVVRTKVHLMVPLATDGLELDVTTFLETDAETRGHGDAENQNHRVAHLPRPRVANDRLSASPRRYSGGQHK
jgi:Fe-S-cluster-containing dehydrogenase component